VGAVPGQSATRFKMATHAAQFDLSSASLDRPKTIAYGLVRGAGNLILQQALTDGTRVAFYMLGEGPWDSILRLWINNTRVTLPASGTVHFHPGLDGEIGNGLAAVSTGGDQHVDQLFTLVPGGLDPITFSRYAWLALKVAPDPAAPSATLTVLADYQAMQVRQFDSSGNQTAFGWTQNWAWIICDFLIRKFVLREGKVNQPLVAAELARFDWASFAAAATYYDAVLSGGQKRFSDGGVVFANDSETADRALEQMLNISRSYILERNGKLSLYADQPRASVFTFTSDNVAPLSSKITPSASVASSHGSKYANAGTLTFKGRKSNLRAAANRITATYRDLSIASGSTDDATRFAISTLKLDHEAHQRAVGARGPGLSVLPKITELALDLGVNTPERVWRIIDAMLVRQLGDDVDANSAYNAPFSAEWTGFEDSLAVEPGDVVTLDKSITEEFGGKLIEVLQVEEVPDGSRNFTGLEYMPNAFPDAAPVQQSLEAPVPGTGLTPGLTVNGTGNLVAIDYMGGVVVIDNANFEVSPNLVNGAPPGWSVANATASYETVSPQSGSQSLKLVITGAFGAVSSLRKFKVIAGELYSISGYMKTAALANGQIQCAFLDANGTFISQAIAQTGTGAGTGNWTFYIGKGTVPTGAVYMVINLSSAGGVTGTFWYDNIHVLRAVTSSEVTALNTSGRSTSTTGALSQVGTTTQISVASKTLQFGFGPVTYSAGSVNPGGSLPATYFVFADDPGFAGGAVTYQASPNESDVYAADGRIYFGKITLASGGGGVSTSPPGTGGGRGALA